MEKWDKIVIFGQKGMIVSALARRLAAEGYRDIILKTPADADLTDQAEISNFFAQSKPDYVFLTSARTGGIMANKTYPADFIYQNLHSQTIIIHAAGQARVKKLLYLASSCIYPGASPQPMKEEYLLSGPLEPTSEPYALAKLAGLKMCQAYRLQYRCDFITAIPSDLYGPEDDFDVETGHVLPTLMNKMHQAKVSRRREVVVWGSGTPRREFLYVDDLADACIFLMNSYNQTQPVNIGFGEDVSILELAWLIREVVGFEGEIIFDRTRPDGAPRKYLDATVIRRLGWRPKTNLRQGLELTYRWYSQNVSPEVVAAGSKTRVPGSHSA
jgi:GDP-L-fucose synthase